MNISDIVHFALSKYCYSFSLDIFYTPCYVCICIIIKKIMLNSIDFKVNQLLTSTSGASLI